MSNTSAFQFFKQAEARLGAVYASGEANGVVRLLAEDVLKKPYATLRFNDTSLSEQQVFELQERIQRLLQHEPIQYILGYAWFMDLQLEVNPSTLIPRPETEELVHCIQREFANGAPKSIIDIGTGSGCIAIALAKHFERTAVYAWDIDPQALATAQRNAEQQQVKVSFSQVDVLTATAFPDGKQLDCIVSNPPYILREEQDTLAPHVLESEPHTALFVTNNDPLQFYKAIARLAKHQLAPNGLLAFEVNQRFAQEVAADLHERGFIAVKVLKDMFGNDRIVTARQSN